MLGEIAENYLLDAAVLKGDKEANLKTAIDHQHIIEKFSFFRRMSALLLLLQA